MATVLFDARLALAKPTGIGRYVASLLPELARAAPDWTFHVLRRPDPWPGYGLADPAAANVVPHVTGERHMSLAQHVRIPRRARGLGADLIHYPHFDAPVLFGAVPVVATVHDLLHLAGAGAFRSLSPAKRAYMRLACRATARRAAAVIAVSRATADDFGRLAGGDPARVTVVPEAADARFRRAEDTAIARFRSGRGLVRPFVLCVAEFRPHKNHARLLAAWARTESRRTHDLVLIGQRHDDGEPPERLAAAAGVADGVRVLDDVSADELVAAYSAADLFVLVSLYEGFGLPVLEAMACDTPVIASATTATGEVAGDAGVLVDPRDVAAIAAAIDRVLASDEERERWIAAGRERARTFSWRSTAERTLEVYRRVLERGR